MRIPQKGGILISQLEAVAEGKLGVAVLVVVLYDECSSISLLECIGQPQGVAQLNKGILIKVIGAPQP